MGHITNPIASNQDFTNENLDLNSNSSPYNTVFRRQHKPYEIFNKSPDFSERTRLTNKANYIPPFRETLDLDPDFNSNPNEEDLQPQYNFQAEDLKQELIEEDQTNKYTRSYTNLKSREAFNTRPAYQISEPAIRHQTQTNYVSSPLRSFQALPEYCYQPLNILNGCIDPKVVGNFWFYNYCTDECMLYAADICDNNQNKFLSLEQCEDHCAIPMRSIGRFLRQKQTQGCWLTQPNDRSFKKKSDYNF